jgi:hypothetical protein
MERLCVFCGSSLGHDPAYATSAAQLGRVLAQRGIGLVYGGGRVGADGGSRRRRLGQDDLSRTWARETRLERDQKGLKGYTPQLTGKYAKL